MADFHLTSRSGFNVAVRESGVRLLRRPQRVEPNGRDRELAALVANVPGAIYRCALDTDWTMAMISDEVERISGLDRETALSLLDEAIDSLAGQPPSCVNWPAGSTRPF